MKQRTEFMRDAYDFSPAKRVAAQERAPLGYLAARRVVELGRTAFFDAHRLDIPVADAAEIAADDLLPQFGFVGERYDERRVLFLGINPGNGTRAQRNAGDARTMPALEAFVKNPSAKNFLVAQQAYRTVCEQWRMWGHECSELLRRTNLSLDEVAFTNALPWRTATTSSFHKSVSQKAAMHYVRPYLGSLRPRILVAVGKKANECLGFINGQSARVVVWNRGRAATKSVIAEREAAVSALLALLAPPHGQAPPGSSSSLHRPVR